MKKICIKQTGSIKGEDIIRRLEAEGGVNSDKSLGELRNRYYFVDETGEININDHIPEGYTEIFIDSSYPKEMKVWDDFEENAVPRTVIGEHEGRFIAKDIHEERYLPFKHAKDIQEEKQKPDLKEVFEKFKEVVKLFGEYLNE